MPYELNYLSVELSSRCQLTCGVCARHTITREQTDMPVRVAAEAARQAHELPDLEYVVLNCWGEPTMNSKLMKIIPMFNGLRSVLSTNCMVYTPGLRASGIRELILSADSFGPRADNAERYLQEPGDANIMVQLLITTATQGRVEAFIDRFKSQLRGNAQIFLKYPVLDPSCEAEPLRADLYDFANDSDIVVAGEPRQARSGSCDQGTSTVVVQADGDVMLHCCSVNKEMVLGPLEHGLLELFNSTRADEIRQTVCAECYQSERGI